MIKIIDSYEFNKDTLAILPYEKDGQLLSIVYEDTLELIVEMTPIEIIKHSCNYYGSSLLGRIEGTKSLIGVTHKAPIILDGLAQIIIFPTHSPRIKECGWINNNLVKRLHKDGYLTIIEFTNNRKLPFDLSYGSLSSQVLRASRLMVVIRNRHNDLLVKNM